MKVKVKVKMKTWCVKVKKPRSRIDRYVLGPSLKGAVDTT